MSMEADVSTRIVASAYEANGRYCCVTNCSNNTKSIDPRTWKRVKMHGFPHPQKEKERCQRWLVNIRRQNLNLTNIKTKKVCSVHFEIGAYSCPSDISNSTLLPSAVPTIINCPNPRKSLVVKRKLPKERIVVQKRSKFEDVDCGSTNIDGSKMHRQLPFYLAESLITSVQKREELYNIHHPGYKSRYVIEQAWKDVAEEVGRDAKFCRTTWSRLRATYNRILAQAKSQPSGSDPSKAPKWYLFHQMSFVRDYVMHGSGIGYLDESSAVTLSEAPPSPTAEIDLDESSHGSSSTLSGDADATSPSQTENVDFSCEEEDSFQEAKEEVTAKKVKRKTKEENPGHSHETNYCQSTREENEGDVNLCFGLLPFMKDMTPRNKRIFYQKALTLCNEILDSQDE